MAAPLWSAAPCGKIQNCETCLFKRGFDAEKRPCFVGYVYDYDETGVHRNGDGWSQCVAIPLAKDHTRDPTFAYMWDAKLHEFTLQADWAPER